MVYSVSTSPSSEKHVVLKNGLKPIHELLGEYILQRPQATLTEMSNYFGYSPSWLSQVTNTDMFKAYMANRMKDIQAVVSQDVPTRMATLAHLAIDRMEEVIVKTQDADTIVDSFDKVMHRYGYAPNAKNAVNQGNTPLQQNNVFFLNQDQFKQVQEKLINAHAPVAAPKEDVSEPEVLTPAWSDVQTSG